MHRIALALILSLLGTIASAQEKPQKAEISTAQKAGQKAGQKNAIANAELPADQAALKAHVLFLADDALKGRETGTPEYDIAARYVASQFYDAGLRPAGDAGSYLQTVPLVRFRASDRGTFVVTRSGAAPVPLAFGEDYLPFGNPETPTMMLDAPVVFVGYGIVAPGMGRDDYAGVDVKGKIVAFFRGAPGGFPGEERAHFGSGGSKAAIAAARGAAAVVEVESPSLARTHPFVSRLAAWESSSMAWANRNGSGHIPAPGTPILGVLSQAGAAKLFAGGPVAWETLARRAEGSGFKGVAFPAKLAVSLKTEVTPLTSANVAGMLPGSDPALKDQVVVLTAHLDHVGMGEPIDGDAIYNGAMDNAVGVAALIEEAKRFRASGKPPRRSILFLAVTAEEEGLIGSDYFAHHPTVPRKNLVANVNLDMPVLTYKFEDVIAFGAQHSSLGETVKRAAASLGVGVGVDPVPEQAFFVRSDHYRFVQQGIPSVFFWPGMGGAGKAAFDTFLRTHYHQPSDEIAQQAPILWDQGVRFVAANYAIAREIADADARPRWNRGDFFGLTYDGYGAR